MGLRDQLNFKITGDEAEAGGGVPPGWYRCTVEAVDDHERVEGALNVVYRVSNALVAGAAVATAAYKGAKINDTLFDPDKASSEKASETTERRNALVAKRLGAWNGDPAVNINWDAPVGREAVVHVKDDTYTDKTTGEKKSSVKVDFAGVFPVDHPKIPADVRSKLNLGAAREETAEEKAAAAQAAAPAGGKPANAASAAAQKKADAIKRL